MNKIILGIIIGAILTLSVQYAWREFRYHNAKGDVLLFDIAKIDLEHKLSGTRVLDVTIHPNSKEKVNYSYDKLYDVHISYKRDGKIKKIITQYGVTKGVWIGPDNTTLEILDDKANAIYSKSGSTK
jgi:hypothetical protein